ncbi:MAG: hypothetical protein U0791_12735 [Gemmataceae bacterium]
MTATEPLTIQVPTPVAKAYREADEEEQRKLELIFGFQLQSAMKDTRTLQEVMRDISRKAIERGMTPEILESILNDDE